MSRTRTSATLLDVFGVEIGEVVVKPRDQSRGGELEQGRCLKRYIAPEVVFHALKPPQTTPKTLTEPQYTSPKTVAAI
ncbi:Uncharacterised protein [Mycobacteroides abscessus subsp. abscessus]|nr:Uncharacterised protein [Mycobacteroides abscessus subsp. abscessus]SIC46233.1 Uncharacterised protein [Mycobacteroides abscessus subsp. abscessus]